VTKKIIEGFDFFLHYEQARFELGLYEIVLCVGVRALSKYWFVYTSEHIICEKLRVAKRCFECSVETFKN